jgi:saccharopine dehydrogenase-like NADP-dependent oxidoreductase
MQKVLVLGAGKSSGFLIDYLAKESAIELKVADISQENIMAKTNRFPHILTFWGDLENTEVLSSLVIQSDMVVSLLPPHLHIVVARLCLVHQKHFLTASYVSQEMRSLHEEAEKKGLLFLMECGLDPGLDHMSAMRLLDEIKENGGMVTSFRSYCGGLVAPESDSNPWGYKVTWNPKNVVLAGQGTTQYLENGRTKIVPYHQLFKRTVPLYFDEFGHYEAYANRDSLSYIPLYGLEKAKTFIRGTIRKKGFCEAWHYLVQLGLTDTSVVLGKAASVSMKEVLKCFLPGDVSLSQYLQLSEEDPVYKKLEWLGLQEDIQLCEGQEMEVSPAYILQKLIEKKWKLLEHDKDMVLMQHHVSYALHGVEKNVISTLSVIGEDNGHTAMAKTVGFPLALATLLIAQNRLHLRGVQTPIRREIYTPILNSLENSGITFT